MDLAHFWFQAAGGPAPYQLGNSLRFRGAQDLTLTPPDAGNGQTWTASFWTKLAVPGALFSAGNSNYGTYVLFDQVTTNRGRLRFGHAGGTGQYVWGFDTQGLYGDPAAWYHIVITLDTTNATESERARLYVNGSQLTAIQSIGGKPLYPVLNSSFPMGTNERHCFGKRSSDNALNYGGYISEAHFVVGTSLDPTDFGEFNADGVWVPKKVSGVTYGPNGWYLDFSDAADIGADRSGNGNDWTPTGFELTDTSSNDYDWMSDSPTQNEATWNPNLGYSPSANTNANTFAKANRNVTTVVTSSDGAEQTWATTAIPTALGGKYYWEVENVGATNNIASGIAVADSRGISTGYGPWSAERSPVWSVGSKPGSQGTAASNGATATGTGTVSFNLSHRLGFLLDLDNDTIEFRGNNTTIATLTNCNFSDYEFLSPFASNYTKVASTANCTMMLRTGNLKQYTVSGHNDLSTAELPAVAITNPSDHFQTILASGTGGIQYKTTATADSPAGTYQNQVYGGDATALGAADGQHPLLAWAAGLTINGHSDWYIPAYYELKTIYTHLKPTTEPNYVAPTNGPNPHSVPPTGAQSAGDPLQTTALAFRTGGGEEFESRYYWTSSEEAANTIRSYVQIFGGINAGDQSVGSKTSSRYARAIRRVAFTGSEPAHGEPYEGGFFAGLYSVAGDGNASHALIVAPKADGEISSSSDVLSVAQRTFPNGLWWIKDRANASTQHQLVDSVRGGNLAIQSPANVTEQAYSAPAGNSVAWCWNAPDAFTSSAGSVASSGRRNVAAGFSIVEYVGQAGDNLTGTIGHGLSSAPEFMIIKNRDWVPGDWSLATYHASVPSTGGGPVRESQLLYLDENLGGNGNEFKDLLGNTKPTNDVFTVSSLDGVSAAGRYRTFGRADNYIAYCWHSVPGYSSFGSYVGNGNADGPFIYTGHRVGWVVVKRTDDVNDWLVCNSATSPYNVVDKLLWPNLGSAEYAITMMDFTSNGFKIRTTNPGWNASGGQYVYMSFAEFPFGGSNVSPSPAR